MSGSGEPATVPARVTVSELAAALDVGLAVVQHELESISEDAGPDHILDATTTANVSRSLGREIRVEARDLALECLYEMDSRYEDPGFEGLGARVERIVRGVSENREALDHEIEAASKHWALARMPMIDRAILRLGLWELKNEPETPTAVIVSEAVRLANSYSTARSASFVNGVLGALSKSVR
ncbi:MAG: transcription antitermination factor NusB [Acidimicrobiia bacterium]|nr:transcription antitermination factor NusB [Acidimicrobiia bacterium]